METLQNLLLSTWRMPSPPREESQDLGGLRRADTFGGFDSPVKSTAFYCQPLIPHQSFSLFSTQYTLNTISFLSKHLTPQIVVMETLVGFTILYYVGVLCYWVVLHAISSLAVPMRVFPDGSVGERPASDEGSPAEGALCLTSDPQLQNPDLSESVELSVSWSRLRGRQR